MFKKLILVLGIMALTLISFQPAFAEVSRVEMQVNGMTCPFCVYGIEKKLKSVEGIEDAGANLRTGIVDIRLKKDKPLNVEKLNEAVRESGFTPGRIKIKATGQLTKYDLEGKEYPALKVTDSNQVFLLTSTPDHEKEEFLGEKKSKDMEKATEGGKKEITITGYVHSHPSGIPPALSVESFEVK
jgi:copper chaperone CopZ